MSETKTTHGNPPSGSQHDPDRGVTRLQVDPSGKGYSHYRFIDESLGELLLELIATNVADDKKSSGMRERTEYWRIVGDGFDSVEHSAIAVARTDHDWGDEDNLPLNAGGASFTCDVDVAPGDWGNSSESTSHCLMKEGELHATGFDIRARYDYENAQWTGSMVWYRPSDSRDLVFAYERARDGETVDLIMKASTFTSNRGCCVTSSFKKSSPPTILGGNAYFVNVKFQKDGADTSQYLSYHSTGTTYYAQHGERAVAHTVSRADRNAGEIHPGDTVFLATTEDSKGYKYLNAQPGYDIWYENNAAGDEEWVVERVDTSIQGPIQMGEKVRLKSVRRSKDGKPPYLVPLDNGYLDTATDADSNTVTWSFEYASQ